MNMYEVVSNQDGTKAPIYFKSIEAAAKWVVDNFGEDGLESFDLQEVNQKQEMDKEIEAERNAQMQEDQANENPLKSIAKGTIRMGFPYMAEEQESTGKTTSGGAIRDIARLGTMFVPTGSVGAMLGMGAGLTAQDVSAQKEYQGEVDPTRTTVGGALSTLPLAAKGIEKTGAPQKVGEFFKNRAAGQMYNVINPNRTARVGKNAMTTEQVKKYILEKDVVPFFSREETALNKMGESVLDDLEAAGTARDQAARYVDEQVPVFYKQTPEVSHMEAIPSDEFISAQKGATVQEMNINNPRKAQYTKSMKKWEKDPYATFMEKPEEPNLVSVKVSPEIDEWTLQKVVEQPEKITRGAYENARRRILVDNRNTPDIGKKIIESLDSWYESMNPKSGGMNAYRASKMVTDLNKAAKTFEKTQGATSAQEEAKSYMAMAINDQIEKASPELRTMSKDMAGLMALKKPVLERAKANAVKASARSGIRSEVGAFLNRGPQSAQAQYNLGKMFIQGSPMLKSGIEAGRQSGTSVGQYLDMEGRYPYKR